MAGEDENHDANIPPPVPPTQQTPHTLSTIKLPILKKGNGPVQVSTDTNGQIRVLPPKTAEEILAREREKEKFGGNDKSKKMQKYILKQQFESFSVSNSEGLHKGYERSLPSSWSKVSLIMRTKPGVDTLSFDDLYNNLRVFEHDVKGSTASSFSSQNVAFVSSESTSSTNEVSTAYDHEDLEQVDEFDLEEMDFKWQVAMISMRLKKFYKKTGRKLQSKGNQESRRRDAGNTRYKAKDNGRRSGKQEEPKALVTLDRDGVDCTGHADDEQENFALMAFINSGLDTEVKYYSKEYEESCVKLKKLYDEQREQLGDASIEIQAYTQALKKMSAKDKSELGYGDQIHEGVLSYEKEVFESVFDSRSSDVEDSPVYDRFAKGEGMHAIPPSITRIYMPPKSDFGIDESNFTYGSKQPKTSQSDAKTSDFSSCESNSSEETLEYVPKPAVNEPKVVSEPKVWSDAPIIQEYESDSDDEYVIKPSKEQEKPSFAFVNIVKHVKTPMETVKEQNIYRPSPKADKKDWNGLMSKKLGLGYGFTRKACFKGKGTGQWEKRPVWNNVQRLNHQNKVVPKAVLTKTGRFPVNIARHNFSSQATTTSTTRKVNTARPIVNDIRPRNNFYKSHSPIRRSFNKTTAPKANFTNHKVNTVGDKTVSVVGGNRETIVKASDDPQKALKNKGIVDSGCSRHMTGNKAYLVEYQDYNGGPVAFGGSKGTITGKDSECLVLSPDFKLPDENQVLLRVRRQNNMYSFNLENIVPSGGLACLISKATVDESNKWNRRFSWVFFLRTKDETSGILKDFIRQIKNQLNRKVKTIRCDNGIEFMNKDIIEFCGSKGIKREYSNAKIP
ncbi:putative ribonuclease H-like domain-containing protein [Tanacetum coccineum]